MRPYSLLFVLAVSLVFGVPPAAQEAILIIRHAEQSNLGHDPNLTDAGQARAQAWGRYFADAGIVAIYTSDPLRNRETGGIVARSLDVPLSIFPKYGYREMLEELPEKHTDHRVLVIANSGTIPSILRRLGHLENENIDKADYGTLFLVAPKDDSPPLVFRLRLP